MKNYVVALPVGSVAKTTLSRHILGAYSPSPSILSIESVSPSGDEVEILNRDDERGARVLKARLFAGDSKHTVIIDAGVTDSEMAAQILSELVEVGQLPADLTVVMPYLAGRKCASGLERFAGKLPPSIRRVLVYSIVQGGPTGFAKVRENDAERKVAKFCAAAGIEICPVPLYYSPLLDQDTPYYSLLQRAGTSGLGDIANIDLDALRAKAVKARGNQDAEAELGLALDAVGFAKRAEANLREVYEYLSGTTQS
jgi:hypothetical protein